MPPRSVQAECLRRAAHLLGGYLALAQRVGVSAHILEWWADGNGEVPDGVFLSAVDVVLGDPAPPTPTRSSRAASTRYRR
jgi:hypothetical protein